MSILLQISEALGRMEDSGRRPAVVLVGNEDAREIEEELNATIYAGSTPLPEGAIVNLTTEARLFNVPVRRVDQHRIIGVIAEGYDL